MSLPVQLLTQACSRVSLRSLYPVVFCIVSMGRAIFIALLFLLGLCAFAVSVRDPQPAAGWCKTKGCKTKDKKRKAAQSGCNGYCKLCFRKFFPIEHSAKQQRRLKTCSICDERKDLTNEGTCKPCKNARSCESCSLLNPDKSASVCKHCAEARRKLGSTKERLAMWCSICFDDEQLSSGKCFKCYQKLIGKCSHCSQQNVHLDFVR